MRRSVIAAVVAATAAMTVAEAVAQQVTILGGGVKGQPYQFAVGMSKLLGEHTDIGATPQSAQGMVAQARLIDAGRADFAWALGGPIGAWAFTGTQRFEEEGPKENLRSILSYPFGTFQWLTLADSGIEQLGDLAGKRVSVGGAASTTQTFAHFFLPAHGLEEGDYDEFTPGFNGGFDSLRDGRVDAHLTVGNAPLSAVQELAALNELRIVDMDEAALEGIVQEYGPGIALATLAPDSYGDNQVNDDPVQTLSIFFGFATRADVSADLVYTVTKALFENLEEFHQISEAAKTVTLEGACHGLAFPLHEGARRYYEEAGLLPGEKAAAGEDEASSMEEPAAAADQDAAPEPEDATEQEPAKAAAE